MECNYELRMTGHDCNLIYIYNSELKVANSFVTCVITCVGQPRPAICQRLPTSGSSFLNQVQKIYGNTSNYHSSQTEAFR
jgi:hypothetical protein